MGQWFKCLVHLVIQSLADSTIRNDQAKDGQESTFYMTTPPLISVRLLSLFWLLKRSKFFNHPPNSSDLNPCDFLLFPRLKKMLSGNKHTSRSSLGSANYQCLQKIPNEDYLSAFRDCFSRLGKTVTKMCFSKG